MPAIAAISVRLRAAKRNCSLIILILTGDASVAAGRIFEFTAATPSKGDKVISSRGAIYPTVIDTIFPIGSTIGIVISAGIFINNKVD